MASAYISELLRRVFWPTTRGADYVSVLIPLALAAIAYFAGIKVSEDATVQILAYVGAFTLSMFLLRLFVTTPYTMWREKTGEVAELKLELSRPERMELAHMAKLRAKARMRLAKAIRQFQHQFFIGDGDGLTAQMLGNEIIRLHAEVSPSPAFTKVYSVFHSELVKLESKGVSGDPTIEDAAPHMFVVTLAYALGQWLHGRITDEFLLLQLLQGIEEEKPL